MEDTASILESELIYIDPQIYLTQWIASLEFAYGELLAQNSNQQAIGAWINKLITDYIENVPRV